ncbi:hypothetical protein [Streptomyces sp. NBC_01361]|uniref:hypothetical protein n=1 Tax=Streptomyces sp. NBC_01361 TaxID=2903838 RepID=UPI002E34B9F6|nr:hypothetical protein [Streptomyces sp. NBC_01361]
MSERPHGYARYRLDGCRCYSCALARSRYDENRDKAIIAGTWQPYVDAEPVRIHIRTLQSCSMGLRAIAAAADVDRKRLQGVLTGRPERGTGPQARVRPEFASAVLAVEPTLDNLAPNTLINPTGTRRRAHALVAGGWPQQHLAVALGMGLGNFGAMLGRPSVLARRARQMRDLYAERWLADPAQHGVCAASITRSHRHAQTNGWAPVGAWDYETIDDPAASPEWTGVCGTPAGAAVHYRIGVPVCPPCREARAAARREARRASA